MPCSTPAASAGKTRGVTARPDRFTTGLDADELHVAILDEGIEDPDCVTAAADTGDDRIWQSTGLFQDLAPRFPSDHRLKLANHQRVRMRAERRAEQVMRVVRTRHPVAHRFIDRVLQRAASRIDALNPRAEQAHAEHVESLPPHVLGAHVDDAFEPEERAGCCARDAVLAGAGLGDDACLAHAPGQQRLPERVVDLVRAGVREILALEEDAPAAGSCGEPPRLPQRCRTADVVREQPRQLLRERRILPRRQILALERLDRRHQRLGHEAAAELAVVAARIRIAPAKPWIVISHLCLLRFLCLLTYTPSLRPQTRAASRDL